MAACPFPPWPLPVARWLLPDWLPSPPPDLQQPGGGWAPGRNPEGPEPPGPRPSPAPERPLGGADRLDARGRRWEPQAQTFRGGAQLASPWSPVSPVTQVPKMEQSEAPPPAVPTAVSCPGLRWKDPGGFSNWKIYFRERPAGSCHPFPVPLPLPSPQFGERWKPQPHCRLSWRRSFHQYLTQGKGPAWGRLI